MHSVDNYVAIDLITEHIRLKLQQPDLKRIYHNLEVIPSNFQIRGMHTIIRDQETQTNDFVFYVRREFIEISWDQFSVGPFCSC